MTLLKRPSLITNSFKLYFCIFFLTFRGEVSWSFTTFTFPFLNDYLWLSLLGCLFARLASVMEDFWVLSNVRWLEPHLIFGLSAQKRRIEWQSQKGKPIIKTLPLMLNFYVLDLWSHLALITFLLIRILLPVFWLKIIFSYFLLFPK